MGDFADEHVRRRRRLAGALRLGAGPLELGSKDLLPCRLLRLNGVERLGQRRELVAGAIVERHRRTGGPALGGPSQAVGARLEAAGQQGSEDERQGRQPDAAGGEDPGHLVKAMGHALTHGHGGRRPRVAQGFEAQQESLGVGPEAFRRRGGGAGQELAHRDFEVVQRGGHLGDAVRLV